MHPGQGPGLSLHDLGEQGGTDVVTLLESEIPAHSHGLMATTQAGNQATPVGNSLAKTTGTFKPYLAPAGAPLVQMSPNALPPAGGSLPHNNMMPYLTLSFCIALQGVFPPRT
jgi:microcystin-dependent protein